MAEQYKDPWGDAANQAVGALYKYYLSQPSAADAAKAAYQQAQIERINVQNEMDNRQMGLGSYALPNLSPEIRNDMYRRDVERRGETDAAKLFGTYVNKPVQVDAGDAKYIVDGSTGLPMQEYGVGVAPQTVADKEGGRLIYTPAIPATNRPAMPIQGDAGRQVIGRMAEQAGVRPGLADATFGAESSYGADVGPSSAGAIGPMQTMPGTLQDPGFGVQPAADPTDPNEQARTGVDYLAAMVNRYKGDEKLALMAYNWGPGNVDNWLQNGADPAAVPAETVNYVQKVLSTDVSGQMGGAPMQPQAPQGPLTAPVQQSNTIVGADGTTITQLPKTAADQNAENLRNTRRTRVTDNSNIGLLEIFGLMNDSALPVTGKGGAFVRRTGLSTGTKVADIDRRLNQLKASESIGALQQMREENKTGAAVGNPTEGELKILQDAREAIDTATTEEDFVLSLMRYYNLRNDIIFRADENSPLNVNHPGYLPTPEAISQMMTREDLEKAIEPFGDRLPPFVEQLIRQRAAEIGLFDE